MLQLDSKNWKEVIRNHLKLKANLTSSFFLMPLSVKL